VEDMYGMRVIQRLF